MFRSVGLVGGGRIFFAECVLYADDLLVGEFLTWELADREAERLADLRQASRFRIEPTLLSSYNKGSNRSKKLSLL